MAKVTGRGVVASILALLVAATCVRLGFWQLDRLQQRRASNAAISGALALPVLDLHGDSLAAVLNRPAAYVNRRVRVTGIYDAAGEVVLRGRAYEGQPGVEIVTPLRVGGGDTAVLVDRGWLPSADATTVDPRPFAEPGRRSVEGIFRNMPFFDRGSRPLKRTIDGVTVQTYQRLQLPVLRASSPYLILGDYVQQLPDSGDLATAPRRVPLPALSEGRHMSYAIQWFSFATIAVFGLLLMLLRKTPDSE